MVLFLGADITDYFNYGFTEDTWKQYCEKQRRMRMEPQLHKKILNFVSESGNHSVCHLLFCFVLCFSFLLLGTPVSLSL